MVLALDYLLVKEDGECLPWPSKSLSSRPLGCDGACLLQQPQQQLRTSVDDPEDLGVASAGFCLREVQGACENTQGFLHCSSVNWSPVVGTITYIAVIDACKNATPEILDEKDCCMAAAANLRESGACVGFHVHCSDPSAQHARDILRMRMLDGVDAIEIGGSLKVASILRVSSAACAGPSCTRLSGGTLAYWGIPGLRQCLLCPPCKAAFWGG